MFKRFIACLSLLLLPTLAHAQFTGGAFGSSGGGGGGGGGGALITSGAGDFGSGTSQTGGVLTGSVVKVNGNTPGNTCTNQVETAIDSSGRGTCNTVTSAYVDSSVALPPVVVALGSVGAGTTTPNLSTCTTSRLCIITGSLTNNTITIASPTNIPGTTSQPALVEVDFNIAPFPTLAFGAAWTAYDRASNRFLAMSSIADNLYTNFTALPNTTDSTAWWTMLFRANGVSLTLVASSQEMSYAALSTNNLNTNFLAIGSDSTVKSMARMPMFFDEGTEVSLSANESMGTFKTVKAITIENIELDIKKSPTCSVSEQITCYDCGASAGACTSAQTSTIMSAVTIASGATRQSIDESITTASVAAGHYISCLITAGTCTVADNAISMMARPQ